MFARLFLIFTAVSLLEIFVLVKVGGFLGAWPTILLVIITAFIGSALVRSQGLELVKKLQERMASGEMPGQQLVEGKPYDDSVIEGEFEHKKDKRLD